MQRAALAFILFGTLLSCTKANPDAPDAAGTGLDANLSPDANLQACSPDTSVCADDVETVCDASGAVARQTTCALGCFDDERCGKLDPSNGLAGHLDDAADGNDVVFAGTATIDTSAGTVTDVNGTVAVDTALEQGGPVDVFVVKVKSLTATDINVVGTAALAIVSDGDVTIDGVLDVSGHFGDPGPGEHPSDQACGGRDGVFDSGTGSSGGGGGGFGLPGGLGGSTLLLNLVNGGTGGATNGNPEVTPLRGGCAGGRGGGAGPAQFPTQAERGSGGGAVQIVSSSVIRLENGGIAANGGGAREDTGGGGFIFCVPSQACLPGHGAGSGGAVLLEASSVELANTAFVVANGGSGSCDRYTGGVDGARSAVRAVGADCSPTLQGGAGGAGTSGNGLDGLGFTDSGIRNTAGGGGGGVGRIRINLPAGETFAPEGLVSPANTAGVLGVR